MDSPSSDEQYSRYGMVWTAKLLFFNSLLLLLKIYFPIQVCWGGGEIPQHWSGWHWAGSRFLLERWGAPNTWKGAVITSRLYCGTAGSFCGNLGEIYFNIHKRKHLNLMVWMISYLLMFRNGNVSKYFNDCDFCLIIFFITKSCSLHALFCHKIIYALSRT